MEIKKIIEYTLRKAGKILLKNYGQVATEYIKHGDPHAIVTKADTDSQVFIVKAIKSEFPKHIVIAEEAGLDIGDLGALDIWCVDPLDGSRNFESRVPLFGINIGYVHEGVVEAAGIYLPSTNELCVAFKGKGTFLNGKKIKASSQKDFSSSYGVGPVAPSKKKNIQFLSAIQNKYPDKAPWINGIGSPAVSAVYTADGRRDWYISRGSKIWDYIAPSLILKEAGCKVTNSHGEDWTIGQTELFASNPYLHQELLELFKAND